MKISEIFYSIQGEGVEVGLPTVFVRLFACDLRCEWCDSMYAVEGRDFEEMSIEDVRNIIETYECKRICITGGEPLLHGTELEELANDLVSDEYKILLETSGHRDPSPIFWTDNCVISMDCKCPSSKMEDRMEFRLFEKLRPKDQLKFVIKDRADYEYAKSILKSLKIEASIIFQPVHGTNLKWLAEKIIEDKLEDIRILPQLHKIIWGETRGV
jgi:7-carboxy-7-deazaguanine synthase